MCDHQESLTAYLYDECEPDERREVEAHLAGCETCRSELKELQAVQRRLRSWTVPASGPAFRVARGEGPPARPGHARRAVPIWGLAAAAVVVIAAAALARVEVRYGGDGLVVRAGAREDVRRAQPVDAQAGAPWQGDLEHLEARLRQEFARAAGESSPAAVTPSDRDEAELLLRVRSLIDESERRQQRELALRVAELVQDFDNQRRADLVRVQQGLGRIENLHGTEVVQQRELLNYLVRVSGQR